MKKPSQFEAAYGGRESMQEGKNKVTATICEFFGIEPDSTECNLFVAEFSDPVFVANTISVIMKYEDLEGTPRKPEKLDYIMLPIIMLGSMDSFIPAGKICKWAGHGLSLSKRPDEWGRYTKWFITKSADLIDEAIATGDKPRLDEFVEYMDSNLDDAFRILQKIILKSEKTPEAKSAKRINFSEWIHRILEKWEKEPKPKTSIEEIHEHCGVFEGQAKVITKHVDEVEGDMTEVRKIWDDTLIHGADDIGFIDIHLADFPEEFRVLHTIARYIKPAYIAKLKETPAIGSEFGEKKFGVKEAFEKRYEEPYKSDKEIKTELVPYYYRVLGVRKDTTTEKIKYAYGRLARIYHSDVGADPDAERKFKVIQKAYRVLSDVDMRAQYDLFEDSYNE